MYFGKNDYITSPYIRFERVNRNEYYAVNYMYDEDSKHNIIKKIKIDRKTYVFLRKLEKKHWFGKSESIRSILPDKTDSEIENIIVDLWLDGLIIADKRVIRDGVVTYFQLGTISEKLLNKDLCRLLNFMLMVFFIPVFVIGLFYFLKYIGLRGEDYFLDSGLISGIMLGTVTGLPLHELGHAISAKAYNMNVYGCGLTLTGGVGAYVEVDTKMSKNRKEKLQTYLAGVETNILLAGIFLLAGIALRKCSMLFFWAAVQNFIVSLLNVTMSNTLDGERAVGEIIGIECVGSKAIHFALYKRTRMNFKKSKSLSTDDKNILKGVYFVNNIVKILTIISIAWVFVSMVFN